MRTKLKTKEKSYKNKDQYENDGKKIIKKTHKKTENKYQDENKEIM